MLKKQVELPIIVGQMTNSKKTVCEDTDDETTIKNIVHSSAVPEIQPSEYLI